MAVTDIVHKLNLQMNREFYSSNLCLQLSSWCLENNFIDTANFLRSHAQGTVTLMMRFFDYLKKVGANPVVTPVPPSTEEYSSLEDLFEQMIFDFRVRALSLAQIKEAALAQNDLPTLVFLQKIEQEQQRDGIELYAMLDRAKSAQKSGMCMKQTDHYLVQQQQAAAH